MLLGHGCERVKEGMWSRLHDNTRPTGCHDRIGKCAMRLPYEICSTALAGARGCKVSQCQAAGLCTAIRATDGRRSPNKD
jgi:hypothetical protein